MIKHTKNYQVFVWRNVYFGFKRFTPEDSLAWIYEWALRIGFVEIRKWKTLKQ